jgi:7-carboxy-7-deazaguanine synthase
MKSAAIHEIFSSIQGEGPYVGERHIFVRFIGCDIRCRFCDTPAVVQVSPDELSWKLCKVQPSPDFVEHEQVPNPVAAADLTVFCNRLIVPGPSRPTLSLTGGEPLLHHEFLAEWLPTVRGAFRIYLETNGIHAGAMRDLRDLVDVVSMDFKLPSATGLRPFWDEHKQFLSAVDRKTLFVKAVVTRDTKRADIITAGRLIAGFDRSVPLILQPAGGQCAPDPAMLVEFQNTALSLIEYVRVIPQIHKVLQVP